jgi:integrase
MTTLRQRAEAYLAMRRRLGFKLTTFGQKLMSFVGYLERTDVPVLTTTTAAAVAWAIETPRSTDPVHWSRRLMVVRVFARHLHALEPATDVPPDDILPHHYRRIPPHLFTPAEVAALLGAADQLRSVLRARTTRTVIGLLAVTGLRTSEACGLDRTDVDLTEGVLTVRDTKFGKSRQVPLHASTVAALRAYAADRDRQHPAPRTPLLSSDLSSWCWRSHASRQRIAVRARGLLRSERRAPRAHAPGLPTAGHGWGHGGILPGRPR